MQVRTKQTKSWGQILTIEGKKARDAAARSERLISHCGEKEIYSKGQGGKMEQQLSDQPIRSYLKATPKIRKQRPVPNQKQHRVLRYTKKPLVDSRPQVRLQPSIATFTLIQIEHQIQQVKLQESESVEEDIVID